MTGWPLKSPDNLLAATFQSRDTYHDDWTPGVVLINGSVAEIRLPGQDTTGHVLYALNCGDGNDTVAALNTLTTDSGAVDVSVGCAAPDPVLRVDGPMILLTPQTSFSLPYRGFGVVSVVLVVMVTVVVFFALSAYWRRRALEQQVLSHVVLTENQLPPHWVDPATLNGPAMPHRPQREAGTYADISGTY
mmetsp:Transcript_29233/g.68855  ORF Transcript_29233/g.68855 Transcript_29233/m.68855 type:complete len:190 (+) Transcript_29233:298-867(+)